MSGPQSAAGKEWRVYWPLVLASSAGFSLHTLSSASLGLFMEPLSTEFGWTRAQVSIVSLVPAILMVLLSPSIGGLIDRWGSRRLALPSIVLTGASFALVSLADGSVWQWIAIWTFYGFVSLGVKMTVWTAAISSAFTAARGLALGVALAGATFGQAAVPPIAQWLIDTHGWRSAYVWLGIGWATPCFLLALFGMIDTRRARGGSTPANPAPVNDVGGITLREALRSVPLLRIGASTLLTMFIGTAILIHQIPILTAGGVSRANAAWLASLAAGAGVVGQLATGWMSDRWNASLIGAISLSAPAIAYVLLFQSVQMPLTNVLAMVIIGYTLGAKLQVCAYLTAHFAGMRHYGKIFGVMASIVAIGGGIGATSAGAIYDAFGSYDPLLGFGIASSLVCGALLLGLDRYPGWQAR